MTTHWAKEEIHRNELAVLVERAVAWTLAHREAAVGGGVTLLIAGFLGVYAGVRYRDLKNTAWERLAVAQSYAFAGQDKSALEQLKDIQEKYPRARAAAFSTVFQGDIEFQTGKYKEAIADYTRSLDLKDPTLEPFARSGIAFSHEAAGGFDKAAEAAQQFLAAHAEHFLAPQVHAVLARSLRALGRAEESKATLEKMALLYTETYWAQWAQNELNPPAAATPAKKK